MGDAAADRAVLEAEWLRLTRATLPALAAAPPARARLAEIVTVREVSGRRFVTR